MTTSGPSGAPLPPERLAGLLRRRGDAGPFWLPVDGTSMGGAILPGSEVEVRAATTPRRGQVWLFCDARGALVVHRCHGPAGTAAWRFRGDAQTGSDAPVPAANLVGVVTAVKSPGGAVRDLTGHLARARGRRVVLVANARRALARLLGR